ncbi:MAG: hypothetical protein ACREH3_03425, partial [Geminicoccales bacterium]
NSAESRGPRPPKARRARPANPLKHGLRAQRYVVLKEEDAAEFAALEAALAEALAPEGALHTFLAERIATAPARPKNRSNPKPAGIQRNGSGVGAGRR